MILFSAQHSGSLWVIYKECIKKKKKKKKPLKYAYTINNR